MVFAVSVTACTTVNENLALSDSGQMPIEHTLIPAPAHFESGESGAFSVAPTTQIVVDPANDDVMRIGQLLAGLIGNTVDTTPSVVTAGADDC